jgi:hypothetical protein|tara:strand:+ start:73 stop:252 length:180 start_codon:yes stop_codon:yes gene_type:complete
MNKEKFNGWFIYWIILILVNFVAYILSIVAGEFLATALSAFMILFCAVGLKQNLRTKEE